MADPAPRPPKRAPRNGRWIVFGLVSIVAAAAVLLAPLTASVTLPGLRVPVECGSALFAEDGLSSEEASTCGDRRRSFQAFGLVLAVAGVAGLARGLTRPRTGNEPAPLGERWDEPRHHDPPGFP